MNRVKFIIAIAVLFNVSRGFGQAEWKSWNSAQLNLSFTKKVDLQVNYIQSYNIGNGLSPDFNQASIRLGYDITKKFSVNAGMVLGSLSQADGANRFFLRGSYKIVIADALNWTNSIQAEIHSPNEDRYRYRLLYITRLGTKKRIDLLRLAPSVSYSLYYNLGGSPVQYYDANENPVVLQTPDGFHRGRLMLNLNSKITGNLSFSVYYMNQQEFNLFSGEYRGMNIINPGTGKIVRPFQKYNVIGASLSLNFDLYKKKSRKNNSTHKNQ